MCTRVWTLCFLFFLKTDEYFLAFPFPLDCIWAEMNFTFDSLQAKKDKKYPVFAPRFVFVAWRWCDTNLYCEVKTVMVKKKKKKTKTYPHMWKLIKLWTISYFSSKAWIGSQQADALVQRKWVSDRDEARYSNTWNMKYIYFIHRRCRSHNAKLKEGQ